MAVEHREQQLLPLGDLTFMWVEIHTYRLTADASDESVLADLIASPEYADNLVAQPNRQDATEIAVHYNWRRDELHPGMFRPLNKTDAAGILDRWVAGHEWTDPNYELPDAAMTMVRQAQEIVNTGSAFKLEAPAESADPAVPPLYGIGGYLEVATIDRTRGLVHLVIAADD